MDDAAAVLRRGGLVAFPTETVYGLGADATNPAAVARIFAAKGRPATNPLIAHVASEATARRYAGAWTDAAARLAAAFWPGPLTLVVPRAGGIADAVTAGGPTVGLRVPNHPVALALLAAFDGPVAAPSANRSNHISPTTADHVRTELGDAVDLILDGGPCAVGIESTVVDVTGDVPRVLRPGGVSAAQIGAVVGRAVESFAGSVGAAVVAASPGQGSRHYAPRTPAVRFAFGHRAAAEAAVGDRRSVVLPIAGTPAEYARQLYANLRAADGAAGVELILVEMPPETAEWAAVRDRLARATVSPN